MTTALTSGEFWVDYLTSPIGLISVGVTVAVAAWAFISRRRRYIRSSWNWGYMKAVEAAHPSERDFRRAAFCGHWIIRKTAVGRSGCPEWILKWSSENDPDPRVRRRASLALDGTYETDRETWEENHFLNGVPYGHWSWAMKDAMKVTDEEAEGTLTPARRVEIDSAIRRAARCGHWIIRMAAAEHPLCPLGVLEYAAVNDGDWRIRELAASRVQVVGK